MLIHIVYNHLARAAGKLFRYVCLFLMRFLNYLARAAATIFKYVCLFPIRERFHKCPLLLGTHHLIEFHRRKRRLRTINGHFQRPPPRGVTTTKKMQSCKKCNLANFQRKMFENTKSGMPVVSLLC